MSVSELTKVPNGYRDPAGVDATREGEQGAEGQRASQLMMGLKPIADQAFPAIGGHDYLGGEPVPTVAFEQPQVAPGGGTPGAPTGAAAERGGMTMNGRGDAKARALKLLKEELGRDGIEGISKGNIPASVAQALLSGRLTARQALERIRKAQEEGAAPESPAGSAANEANEATDATNAPAVPDTAEASASERERRSVSPR